ncbi:Hypothetical_protein [Hexamita inflata]|uniref:Hypothetical_protein n=1 Tax=Hexamita inflata TaxID=28002 RepID=A0AA86RA18_9EUKA|nr:Hypothetical protein HINF_LOCUS59967 [Hexamita inflata]
MKNGDVYAQGANTSGIIAPVDNQCEWLIGSNISSIQIGRNLKMKKECMYFKANNSIYMYSDKNAVLVKSGVSDYFIRNADYKYQDIFQVTQNAYKSFQKMQLCSEVERIIIVLKFKMILTVQVCKRVVKRITQLIVKSKNASNQIVQKRTAPEYNKITQAVKLLFASTQEKRLNTPQNAKQNYKLHLHYKSNKRIIIQTQVKSISYQRQRE